MQEDIGILILKEIGDRFRDDMGCEFEICKVFERLPIIMTAATLKFK